MPTKDFKNAERDSQVLTSILSHSKAPSAESKTENQLRKIADSASFSPLAEGNRLLRKKNNNKNKLS